MELFICTAIVIGMLIAYLTRDNSVKYNFYQEIDEVTEDDASPIVELAMFDDFMEDGDLDIF